MPLWLAAPHFLLDSSRSLDTIENELARGHAVNLLDDGRIPQWARWRVGKARSRLELEPGDALVADSWTLALLELLPDTRTDRYKITAQLRHDKADTIGEVGLYVADTVYGQNGQEVHFFVQLAFNAVRGDADRRAGSPVGARAAMPLAMNVVRLNPRLYSDEAVHPNVNLRIAGAAGPRFNPLGDSNGRWHDLELSVTPDRVLARWSGQTFELSAVEIQRKVTEALATHPPRFGTPWPTGYIPTFNTRGGVGLYVFRSSAAFRHVSLTPL